MKISLQTGKVIDIPIDKYLELSEAEYEDFIQRMIASDCGVEINDPFVDISDSGDFAIIEDIEIEPLPEEIIQEIKNEIQDE